MSLLCDGKVSVPLGRVNAEAAAFPAFPGIDVVAQRVPERSHQQAALLAKEFVGAPTAGHLLGTWTIQATMSQEAPSAPYAMTSSLSEVQDPDTCMQAAVQHVNVI